jgi:PPOX class probable F420-dependent enzyme
MQSLESVRDYLSTPICAVVSTVRADGSPHQTVLHYWLEDNNILINGTVGRIWTKNLHRDPRVSILVHDPREKEHWVGIRGHAAKAYEGHEAVEDAMDLARRYGDPPEDYAKLERVMFVIEPERLFEYGAAPAPG